MGHSHNKRKMFNALRLNERRQYSLFSAIFSQREDEKKQKIMMSLRCASSYEVQDDPISKSICRIERI